MICDGERIFYYVNTCFFFNCKWRDYNKKLNLESL
jgi:hypothetical protein